MIRRRSRTVLTMARDLSPDAAAWDPKRVGRELRTMMVAGDEEWFGLLSGAVVAQAVMDYRNALLALKTAECESSLRKARNLADDVEAFFLSGWFQALSDYDGPRLMEMIQETAED